MPERVVLFGSPPRARIETDAFTGEVPVFVARALDGELPEDGVLLREGQDEALVRAGGRLATLPLYHEREDGSLARVRVARIDARRSR